MFEIPKLKFATDALEPYMSKDTVRHHYGKHTKKYFETTNKLIEGTIYEKYETLDELLPKLEKGTKLYNQAMQAANHAFWWEGLNTEPGKPGEYITEQFETLDKFIKEFTEKSVNHFGSGWCWLVRNNKKLEIITTSNADRPDGKPILVVDFWEHAYLYDKQYAANRPRYLENIWRVVDWNVVNERWKDASSNK